MPRTDPMINVWPLIRPMHYSANFKPFIVGEILHIEAASWFMVSAGSHTNTLVLREEPVLHRYSLQLLSCRSYEYTSLTWMYVVVDC